MRTEHLPRVSEEGIHYLDFGAYPQWLVYLYNAQLNDPAVGRLAGVLGEKIQNQDGPASRLRKIQQYIHDDTYHLSQQDWVRLFGFLPFESLPYPRDLIYQFFETINLALLAHPIESYRKMWEENLNLKRVIGSKMGSLTKNLELVDLFRGTTPLGCAEEATLAAALATLICDVRADQIAFFISPVHIVCFVRPGKGLNHGCVFDSKMLYGKKDVMKFGGTVEERKSRVLGKLGQVWSVGGINGITSILGLANLQSDTTMEIVQEFDNFLEG